MVTIPTVIPSAATHRYRAPGRTLTFSGGFPLSDSSSRLDSRYETEHEKYAREETVVTAVAIVSLDSNE
jgi:hypothetical protein